ncbi:hypothetical protein QBC39DRAFT_304635 [Podospora conica]|nr:hypothetical protein QBC39DRAFT_304635 [Schizothecium conicum]
MHLILTGATGLIGTAVLDAMLSTPSLTKISILSRRPVPMADAAHDPRVHVILHSDFTTYDDPVLLDRLADATGCVWALGTSQAGVGREEYKTITKTFPLAFARALTSHNPNPKTPTPHPFNFIHISGTGATFSPSPFTPLFGVVKGQAELGLAALQRERPHFRVATVRAGAIDWGRHEAIWKYMPPQSLAKRVEAAGFPLLRALYRKWWTPTEELGGFVTGLAMGRWGEEELRGAGVEVVEGGMVVVENEGFQRVWGV